MEKLTRRFVYQKKNLVMLLCDFYDCNKIPGDVLNIESNIGLFPIEGRPLIEHIIQELYDQNFRNVILVARDLRKILQYIKDSRFIGLVNFAWLDESGGVYGTYPMRCLSDVFKALRPYEIAEPFLFLQANQLVHIDFSSLFRFHEKRQPIISLFLHPRNTNDPEAFFYEIYDSSKILYCEKSQRLTPENSLEIQSSCGQRGNTKRLSLSSPNIFICSSRLSRAFEEMSHCRDIVDLIQQISELSHGKSSPVLYVSSGLLGDDDWYCKEITTLSDFVEISQDFHARVVENFTASFTMNFSLSPFDNQSFSSLHQWSIVPKNNEQGFLLDLGSGRIVDCFSVLYVEETFKVEKPRNFFDEVFSYLLKIHRSRVSNPVDNKTIWHNVTLFRIVWNTSDLETLEVFADFYVNGLHSDLVSISASQDPIAIKSLVHGMSNFILVIRDLCRSSIEYQIHFIESFVDEIICLDEKAAFYKWILFFEYFLLFKELKLVKNKILKKYYNSCKNDFNL